MNRFSICCLTALSLLGAACTGSPASKVPPGQLSAKMIHNPRTAEGISPSDAAALPVLTFPDTAYDFGTMSAGERGEHEFSFKNTGKSPLIITGAGSSCGCTVPAYPHEPVQPGGGGNLKVTFSSAGKQGHILKVVTVSSNAFPSVRLLTITADIKPEPGQ